MITNTYITEISTVFVSPFTESLVDMQMSGADSLLLSKLNNAFSNCTNLSTGINTSTYASGLQSIPNWNTANVTVLANTFSGCTNFNPSVLPWNTESAYVMQAMFFACSKFNCAINFNIQNVGSIPPFSMSQMFDHCTSLTPANYSSILNNFANNTSIYTNVILGASDLYYNSDGTMAHNTLVNEYNWTINDSGLICFAEGTLINTPLGYIPIENLKKNDMIISYCGEHINIKEIYKTHTNLKYNNMYKLEKNRIEKNIPFQDLYLSQGHCIKVNNKWHHMHHSNFGYIYKNEGYAYYYHIIIDDYFKYSLNANGVETEACYIINNHETLKWTCDSNECICVLTKNE